MLLTYQTWVRGVAIIGWDENARRFEQGRAFLSRQADQRASPLLSVEDRHMAACPIGILRLRAALPNARGPQALNSTRLLTRESKSSRAKVRAAKAILMG